MNQNNETAFASHIKKIHKMYRMMLVEILKGGNTTKQYKVLKEAIDALYQAQVEMEFVNDSDQSFASLLSVIEDLEQNINAMVTLDIFNEEFIKELQHTISNYRALCRNYLH